MTGVLVPVSAAEHGKTEKAKPKPKAEKKEGEKGGKKDEKKKEAKTAPKPKKEEGGKVGYGIAIVQMSPMMAPYRTPAGVRYELLTVRISLGPNDSERPACCMIPIVHEKMLLYLNAAHLQATDFVGQRKEVLENALLDVAIKATDKSLYTKVKLVDANAPATAPGENVIVGSDDPALEPRSATLSAQCK